MQPTESAGFAYRQLYGYGLRNRWIASTLSHHVGYVYAAGA